METAEPRRSFSYSLLGERFQRIRGDDELNLIRRSRGKGSLESTCKSTTLRVFVVTGGDGNYGRRRWISREAYLEIEWGGVSPRSHATKFTRTTVIPNSIAPVACSLTHSLARPPMTRLPIPSPESDRLGMMPTASLPGPGDRWKTG